MLTALRALVGPSGKIACVDTEHGSLSKYADTFEFDVIELDTFSPENFSAALKAAEDAGYEGFGCDSMSHFWMGQGGALEFVDNAKRRSSSRDDMSGWKEFSPVERRMIDQMIASAMHIGVTMRTKTEYQDQVDERTGKKKRIKIGLAPVQRQGLEYEFDLIGYMDEENTFITDKTRCPFYAQKAIVRPDGKAFAPFAEWLRGAKREMLPIEGGTEYAAHAVGQQKIVAMQQAQAEGRSVANVVMEDGSGDPEETLHAQILHVLSSSTKKQPPYDKFAMLQEIGKLKKRFLAINDEATYRRVLKRCGAEKSNELPTENNGLMGRVAYKEMTMLLADLEPPASATPEPPAAA
jgi:hypothetical protein